MSRFLKAPITFLIVLFVCGYAFAQDAVTPGNFLDQILQSIQGFGGLSMVLKIASLVTLVISSMKVSLLKPLWDKLGAAQPWVGPLLGALGGLASLVISGQTVSLPILLAYFGSGAGSIILHELLDSLKLIPGLGPQYVGLINTVEGLLGGGTKSA